METPTRVALVTGAAQGIGEQVAVRLAQDGYDVAILDVKGKEHLLQAVAQKISAFGRRSHWLICDVAVGEEVKQAIEQVVKELASLDVMVANAGITLFKPLLETSIAEWSQQFNVNAVGTMLCFEYAALQMIKQV